MDTDELEDLYAAVLGNLKTQVGEKQMKKWGYLTIKDWVRDQVEQCETDADKVTRFIIEESSVCESF